MIYFSRKISAFPFWKGGYFSFQQIVTDLRLKKRFICDILYFIDYMIYFYNLFYRLHRFLYQRIKACLIMMIKESF